MLLRDLSLPRVDVVGHRVVHGGEHILPERITPDLLTRLHALIPLAPLHLPRRYRESCIRRYGFHGLSCEYIVRELGVHAQGRVVVAHLGSGASLAALSDGRSIDTTMGFTPCGGVMMGTPSGDLDPGVLLYMMREQGVDAAALEHLLNHEAGLLGVSELSPDMSVLLDHDEAGARLAVGLFSYQVRKAVGALATTLGGLDRLVFTGGIGEHAAPVRASICNGLEHLGVTLDPVPNAANNRRISSGGSDCEVLVIPADEDSIIAQHCRRILVNQERTP